MEWNTLPHLKLLRRTISQSLVLVILEHLLSDIITYQLRVRTLLVFWSTKTALKPHLDGSNGNQTHTCLIACQEGEVKVPDCLWKGGGMVSFTSAFLHAGKICILSCLGLKSVPLKCKYSWAQIGLLSCSMLILLVNTESREWVEEDIEKDEIVCLLADGRNKGESSVEDEG